MSTPEASLVVTAAYRGSDALPPADLELSDAGDAEGVKYRGLRVGGNAAFAAEPDVVQISGRIKVNRKDELTYVWTPPGTFTMGCSPNDAECSGDEKPAHPVTLSKGFWLGQTEVKQEAYERVTGANPGNFKGPRFPVENIGWNEAQGYCHAAGMRLPTEAEWEFAARAGATGGWYGNINAIAWCDSNSGSKTHEVAQKQANAFGLYDMLGNVWEWVSDWYGPYAADSQTDPGGPNSGQFRVQFHRLRFDLVQRFQPAGLLVLPLGRAAEDPGVCHGDWTAGDHGVERGARIGSLDETLASIVIHAAFVRELALTIEG